MRFRHYLLFPGAYWGCSFSSFLTKVFRACSGLSPVSLSLHKEKYLPVGKRWLDILCFFLVCLFFNNKLLCYYFSVFHVSSPLLQCLCKFKEWQLFCQIIGVRRTRSFLICLLFISEPATAPRTQRAVQFLLDDWMDFQQGLIFTREFQLI